MRFVILILLTINTALAASNGNCKISMNGIQHSIGLDESTFISIMAPASCESRLGRPTVMKNAEVRLYKDGSEIASFFTPKLTYSTRLKKIITAETVPLGSEKKISKNLALIFDLKRKLLKGRGVYIRL